MTLPSSFLLAMVDVYGRGSSRMAVVKWVESSHLTLSKPWGRCLSQLIGKSLQHLEVLSVSFYFLGVQKGLLSYHETSWGEKGRPL